MQAEKHPNASADDALFETGPTPGIVTEGADQAAVQQTANAPIQDHCHPAELPATAAEQNPSQYDPMSVPQPENHHAEGINNLASITSATSADTEQHLSPAVETITPRCLDLETANPCTATITDPSELPVQPYLSETLTTGEENIIGESGSPPGDATAQAHVIMAAAVPPPAQLPGVVTQIAPAMQPDNDSTDEAYAESTTTSFVTSIKSEVSRGVLENERLYPSYGQHDYGMPIDEDELDRMDLQHRKYEMVIGDKHFLAPIGPTPQRILDLGTGTGIWALDVADMYSSAEVIGVDIAPIQPKWTASNCQFEIDDVEETWTFKDNSFDFIHFRDPLYVVRNWPRLMDQCYSHTKPGGWCELACIYPVPMCDDETMPADSGFKVICDKFIEASYLFGTPADSPLRFAKYLRDAGFVDVAEHIFKVPSSPWPKNKRLKQIGALEMTNVVAGATAFGLRAFEKVFGWTKDQTELAMVNFRRDVKNRHYHQYCQ